MAADRVADDAAPLLGGRIGVVELTGLVGQHELCDAQTGAALHLALEVRVVLALGGEGTG